MMSNDIAKKKYCDDCKKIVETATYNEDVDPKLVVCVECGQFCHDSTPPKELLNDE